MRAVKRVLRSLSGKSIEEIFEFSKLPARKLFVTVRRSFPENFKSFWQKMSEIWWYMFEARITWRNVSSRSLGDWHAPTRDSEKDRYAWRRPWESDKEGNNINLYFSSLINLYFCLLDHTVFMVNIRNRATS